MSRRLPVLPHVLLPLSPRPLRLLGPGLFRLGLLGLGMLGLGMVGLGTASAQAAEPEFKFGVPENYFGRFAGVAPVFELTAEGDINKLGLSGIPLPTEQDLRFTVTKRPDYWDYALSTRADNTTYLIGTFDQDPRIEVMHDPWTGPQFNVLARVKNVSELSGGYAFTTWEDRARIYNKAGLAYQNEQLLPFTYSQAALGYGKSFGPLSTSVAPVLRVYTFPTAQKAQASADLVVSAGLNLSAALRLEASHFERLVEGEAAIPAYGLGRIQETNLSATYRLPYEGDPNLALGALRTRYTHNWLNDWNYVRGDLFLRSSSLPVMFGPSIEYHIAPDGEGNRWVYNFVTLGK